MKNQKTEFPYFLDKLPKNAQNLFHDDPKQFRILYGVKLGNVVKQDLIKMAEFVTPVHEVVHFSSWYDSWIEKFFWYNIASEYQQDAMKLFKIYCPRGTTRISFVNNALKLEATDKDFFNLLRAAYYYTNYTNKNMWTMPHIQTLHKTGHDICPEIAYKDFIDIKYNYKTKKTILKMHQTKKEIGKTLQQGCEKIAGGLMNNEIARITNINEQIKAAKATLAKYGTELVKGY